MKWKNPTVMTSPGMYWILPWECLCPKGGTYIIQSAINRWSDSIGQDRNRCHFGTLSTILLKTLHTHNETQWPTAACWCHFVLRGVSCRQSWHLSTPSHPLVIPIVTILLASPVRTLVYCVVKHSRPHPKMSASYLHWLQGPQQTPTYNLYDFDTAISVCNL